MAITGNTGGANTLASILVGAIATLMLKVCEPPPDPSGFGDGAVQAARGWSPPTPPAGTKVPWRRNVLLLAFIGSAAAVAICILAGFIQPAMNIAAGMIGAVAASMAKLAEPDDPAVPASVVKEVLDVLGGALGSGREEVRPVRRELTR